VALLPELEPASKTITLCLKHREIRSHGLTAGVRLRHLGQSLVRCRQGALLEGQELGVNLDPAARLFRVRRLRILAFEKPIRIHSFPCGSLRIHVFEIDAFKSKRREQPGPRPPKGSGDVAFPKPALVKSSKISYTLYGSATSKLS